MSLFGEPRESGLTWAIRITVYFLFGVLMGIFPALLIFSGITIAPHANAWMIALEIFALICLPFGVFFMAVGVFSRGRFLAKWLRFLGKNIDYP